eukprot:jgi/Antlo1/2536/1047
MSVDRSTENDNSRGDLKSSETGHGKNDVWIESGDENKDKEVVAKSLESKEKQSCLNEEKEISDQHAETNVTKAKASLQDGEGPASEVQEDRQMESNKGMKDSGTSRTSVREPTERKRPGSACEENKSGVSMQQTRDSWGDCVDSRWGDVSGSRGGASEHKSWNDADRYTTRGIEQGRRDFRQPRPRGYAEQDSWERRGPPRRQYEPREGSYEERRRYESLDYPLRKRRFDDGNFAQGPSRFREGARGDLQRRQEWHGRDEMPHKEGWSSSRMSHDTREGFDSRGGWSRERVEGYARAPHDGFGMGDGWSRHRDGFVSHGGAGLPREGWSRARQDAYGDVSGRDLRRGDTASTGWPAYQSHSDFNRDGGYGGGRSEFKRYRQNSEGPRYHPYGYSGTPYEFGKKREIPVNPPPSRVIGLFGLSSHATLDDVKEFLAEKIPGIRYEKVHLVRDGYTGQSRGFGFVYFSSLDEAITAKEQLQGQSIYNKVVRVDYSVSEGPRTTNIENRESN